MVNPATPALEDVRMKISSYELVDTTYPITTTFLWAIMN